MIGLLRQLWRSLFSSRSGLQPGRSSDQPEDLRDVLVEICQQPGEPAGAKVLLHHEGEVLLRTLEQRSVSEERVIELVEFLRRIDSMSATGWNDHQCEAYIASATTTVAMPQWVTGAFEALGRHQAEVAKETGARLFRTSLLKAAVAFALTGLDPDDQLSDLESRVTG